MGRFNSLELDSVPMESQPKEERKQFGEAVKDANYYLKEATELFVDRELEPALRSFSKALEIDPGSAEAWNGQIRCLILLDELHEAEVWSKKAAEIVGETQDLLALRARVCCRRGDFDRAYGLSDAAMQAPGNSPLIWIVRGEIMLYARNKEPEYCFDKAIAAAGKDYTVAMDIAESCAYAGRYTLAMRYLKPASEAKPDSAAIWIIAANCFRMLGKRKKAIECLEAALEIDQYCPGGDELKLALKHESRIKNLFRRIFK